MFKNLKLAGKIALGFGSLIAISMLIGGIAVYNMNAVKTKSMLLANEYVPEVDIAVALRGAANRVMYANRGYGYTEDKKFYEEGQKELKAVQKSIDEAKELDKEAKALVKLGDQIKSAEAATALYAGLVEQTLKINEKIDAERKTMDVSAAAYLENCNAFLESQNVAMNREIRARKTNLDRLSKISLINNIIDAGNTVRVANFRAQATRDPETFSRAIKTFEKSFGMYDDLLKITRLNANIKQIANTKKAAQDYTNAMRAFLDLWEAREALGGNRNEAGREVIEACKIMADAGMGQTKQLSEDAATSLASSSLIMIIGLIIALFIGVVLAIFITKSIVGPINKIIEGLSGGSEQVASASEQLSSTSQSMSEGASEQASSLEEVSSSLEEMSSMTKQNAQNAKQANTLSTDASGAARQSKDAMVRMSDAIDKIKTSSDETAKIIKTIDEIAMQTNLLALNAAVEAARAGEAGRGFAVVAEEVRNLAQRSAEAAKSTAELIEGSQKNSDNGVTASAEVTKIVEQIMESIQKVAQLIAEVSAASDEQSQGIDQVNTAVAQMDKVTQNNAANSEESASASEELSSQAQNLNAMVDELINIVGGSSTKSHGSISAHSDVKQTGSVGPASHFGGHAEQQITELTYHSKKGRKAGERRKTVGNGGKGKLLVTAGGQEVSPEQVIPLDDDKDLKEF